MDTFLSFIVWLKFPYFCIVATFCISSFAEILREGFVNKKAYEGQPGLQFLQFVLMSFFAAVSIWSVTRAVQTII